MNEIRPQQWLASPVGQHSATRAVQPVHGAFGRVLTHALHLIVESPTIVAVQIAFELSEEIRNQRMKVARRHTRTYIRKQPALHRVIDLPRCPSPLVRRRPLHALVNRCQQFRMLGKYWLGKLLRLPEWLQAQRTSCRAGQQIMQGNIQTKTTYLLRLLLDLHALAPQKSCTTTYRSVG